MTTERSKYIPNKRLRRSKLDDAAIAFKTLKKHCEKRFKKATVYIDNRI